mgnify:CR=1 FL=1
MNTPRKSKCDRTPTKSTCDRTPTPRTDEWETYCDECYYHLWRLRRKNERGFNDGFHINNGEEAKGLCDLLNNLEAELAAVTEQLTKANETIGTMIDEIGMLQLKDKATTEQRDRLAEALESIVGESAYEGLPESKQQAIEQALQSLNQNASVEARQ